MLPLQKKKLTNSYKKNCSLKCARPALKFKWFSHLVFALQAQVQVLVLHLFRFIYLFSHDGCMQKERKVAACAFMDSGKLRHIDMELTLFLV